MKNFDDWNTLKQITESKKQRVYFKERDIFWLKLGENIGHEQNGKGEKFQRPVLVVRKYTNEIFLGVPLSTTMRDGSFFFQFQFLDDKISTALLVQNRLFSSKRLMKKIGKISEVDFVKLKSKLKDLIG
ncbi:MAG: type II toxin-antitoxin system PemK/MazF family toxin [Sulfurimonas sp.]|jgi:mRNA-degrading endonuclease toxin of MazEF toxin-antitoxin module